MLRTEILLIPMFTLAVLMVVYTVHAKTMSSFWIRMFLWGFINGFSVTIRHFGFFIVVFSVIFELILCFEERKPFVQWLGFTAVQLFVGIVGYLFVQHVIGGSGTAFNAKPKTFHLALILCLKLKTLFTHPIRPELNYCFFPSLYADFWGDYWRYWVEHLGIFRIPSSAKSILLLKEMMRAAILPTFLLIGGFVKSLWNSINALMPKRLNKEKHRTQWEFYVSVLFFISFLLYVFLASLYAIPGKGDSAKGIYIVYLVPVAGVLAGYFASWLGAGRKWLKSLIYAGGICFFYFSLPICLCLQGIVKS
jgi:hypothetical protein